MLNVFNFNFHLCAQSDFLFNFQITISEIEHFDNEEEVVEMDDWDFISKPTDT